MFTRRGVLTAGTVASAALSQLAASAARAAEPPPAAEPSPNTTPPSLDELLRDPEVIDTALSPDGTRYAVLFENRTPIVTDPAAPPKKKKKGEDPDPTEKREAFIILGEIGDKAAPLKRVPLGDFSVYQVEWANNERLLFWIRFEKGANGQKTGMWYGDTFFPIPVLRVASIDTNGTNLVVLFANQKNAVSHDFNLASVVDMMASDPTSVLMQMWDYGANVWALHKVNVYTGEAAVVEKGTSATDSWFIQDGVPVLRWDSNTRGTVVTVMARGPGEAQWKQFRKFRRDELKVIEDFHVVGATPEAGVVLVANRQKGEDTVNIRTFDVRTMDYGKSVAHVDGHDLTGAFVDEAGVLVGSSYIADRRAYAFVDPTFAPHFKGINNYFGNDCNVYLYDVNLEHSRFLLHVVGPRQPGAFYIYDRAIHDLRPIGDQKPWLNEERLAGMEALKVKTRDGAEISAYLSTPPGGGAGPKPMVVMPHGGPHGIRDDLDFDKFVQALAARGWLILQPNYRGSGGYGRTFEDLGRRHWADRMQEDVDDAVAQVVAAGKADPKRIAIWGWSYGGYAALMQAVLRPDLYKAAVSIAGDADMFELLNFSKHEDGADSESYAFWLATVGDPKNDEAMLKRSSPALRAAEIQAPIFLANGTEDTIVSPKQSKIMAKALKDAGKTCEYVEFKGEGHSGWSDDNLKKVLTQSADFIAKYI